MLFLSRMNDQVSVEIAGQYKLFLTYFKCMRFSRMNDQVSPETVGPCKMFLQTAVFFHMSQVCDFSSE